MKRIVKNAKKETIKFNIDELKNDINTYNEIIKSYKQLTIKIIKKKLKATEKLNELKELLKTKKS